MNFFVKELRLSQQHDYQDHELGFIVLEVHRQGESPVKIEVPANAIGKDAVKLVAQHIGINAGIWPGLCLVTSTGEKIHPEETISRWDGRCVRLGVTHTSMLTGK